MIEEPFNKFELLLLAQALKRPEGLEIWRLTGRLGVSVRDAAAAFKSLSSAGFLVQEANILRLTPKGRGWIMQHQAAFSFSGEKLWRRVPDDFQAISIDAFQPYAPRISRLEKSFFKICIPGK
jgi:hypothetical protein